MASTPASRDEGANGVGAAAPQTLDERVAENRAKHDCLQRLDAFMFCMTLTNQMGRYYRDGTYEDCPKLFHRWRACLESKLSTGGGAEGLRAREREVLSGEHVFLFKPAYAEEAKQRYNIDPGRTMATESVT